MPHFIGKGKFVYSNEEKQAFKNNQINKYNEKYISVSRLKKEYKYTDKIIIDFLPKPKKLYVNCYNLEVRGWQLKNILLIEEKNKELKKLLDKRRT
jgi:hypothetical protein